jgi:formylglycine-generating enzyme required for sulfatase activity
MQKRLKPEQLWLTGIDSDTLRSVCEDRGEPNPDRCVQIITEDAGSTNTYSAQILSFWIDRYEVTIEQFVKVCTSNYIWFPEGCIDRHLAPELTVVGNQPQVGVSYMDAIAYCGARGARLPTEEEWEYAASGSDKLIFPWGDEFVEDYVHS